MPICPLSAFLAWSWRRWVAAAGAGLATFLLLGLPTAVIPNPVFGRSIAPTDWSMTVLVATAVLGGLLFATYVRNEAPAPGSLVPAGDDHDGGSRGGAIGGLLSFLAIGCPVCNKVALLALGATGAVEIFAPVQPYLAVAGVGVLVWALAARLRGEMVCALPLWLPAAGESDGAAAPESGPGEAGHSLPSARVGP